ncbi:MAG: anti-sigma B factor antagonist [Cognaticolwellia sp.]|jgi:anti-sigma B factor antagonist|tara:strand:- start:2081 stop:2452 length:372 start_codon:yes stop_codon:yes gene_type:complete
MEYTLEVQDNFQVLTVDNLTYEYENQKVLDQLLETFEVGNSNLVINLSNIKYMNSMGLRFVLALLTKTRNKGGDTVLIEASEQVNKLLIMTKLQSIFHVFENIEAVITSGVFEEKGIFEEDVI